MFDIYDPHPIALPASDSNTDRPCCPILCMCLTLILIAYLPDIQTYQAVKGVIDSYDALVDLLESIEHFLNRLDIYTKIPPTVAMTEVVVKILVEMLSALALVTEQIKQGKPSESAFSEVLCSVTQCNAEKLFKKFLGEKDVEAVVQRLDRLTLDEARITAAQTLEVVYGLVQNMRVMMDSKPIHQSCSPALRILCFRRKGIGRLCPGYSRYVFLATT